MKLRLLLATILSLPCLSLVGCGSSSTSTAEISNEPMSAADIAAAQADMDKANESERAYQQSVNPTAKKPGQNR